MGSQRSKKLKYLLNVVPPGFLVDGRFLRAHHFQSKSIGDYVSQGGLERLVNALDGGLPAAFANSGYEHRRCRLVYKR